MTDDRLTVRPVTLSRLVEVSHLCQAAAFGDATPLVTTTQSTTVVMDAIEQFGKRYYYLAVHDRGFVDESDEQTRPTAQPRCVTDTETTDMDDTPTLT